MDVYPMCSAYMDQNFWFIPPKDHFPKVPIHVSGTHGDDTLKSCQIYEAIHDGE